MNTAYVYLQLYRLFDNVTPIAADCGHICSKACCQGDDCGMYLFPGELEVYSLLKPDWIKIERSDFKYTHNNKTYSLPICFCNGSCDRFQRPLSCRIFPLTPILDENKKLKIIKDPRGMPVCPLSKAFNLSDFDRRFVKQVENSFKLLMKNELFSSFMEEYTAYINDFKKFFK